ncbi:MAG: DUF5103 domain-containing protein [Saprospiraceae bacterium]|nr:DUF5103 domain-containing protein [Saprospiraceae bacterium]
MNLLQKVLVCYLLFTLMGNLIQDLKAQSNEFELPAIDTIYDDRIKSIFFYRTYPEKESIAFLTHGKQEALQLQFDFLIPSAEDLYYSFFHFDKNWKQDELRHEEFLKGFQEEQIYSYVTSRNTKIPFVHYQLQVESEDFLVSGNYLMCVYNRQKQVLFTRRFFVTEQQFHAAVEFINPLQIEHRRTHHSMEMEVKTGELPVANNGQELFVQAIQNGDFNTLIERNEPNFYTGDAFKFTRPDDFIFPAKKEFRFKDIRTLISRTPDIQYWDEKEDGYHAWLIPDGVREGKSYYTETDINGKYLILNRDVYKPETESDYAWMHFTLKTGYELDEPIYLFGAVSDWQIREEFRMDYDESRKAYMGQFLLKLGYYNYLYAYRNKDGLAETDHLEGNWYETENNYAVFIYYRPFGSRYDRLMFAGIFNSNY